MIKYVLIALSLLVVISFAGWKYGQSKRVTVSTYEECVAAGYPVMESFPEQCATPDGRTYTKLVGESSEMIADIAITGEVVCLPHKDTSGPQTLECAFGIKNESGDYYGLSDSRLKFIDKRQNGNTYAVTGILTDASESIYAINGMIEIVSMEAVE